MQQRRGSWGQALVIVAALVAVASVSHRLYRTWRPPISCSADVLDTETSMTRQECKALAAIYNANARRGDAPKRLRQYVPPALRDWEAEPNPCLWAAVTCRSGHLTELSLVGDFDLDVVIPPEIGHLSHLTRLNIDADTDGLDPLPDEIAELGSLESLSLTGDFSKYEFVTPSQGLIDLSGLESLRELSLVSHERISFFGFDQLPSLTSLTLSIDYSIPDEVFGLTGLTRLQLLGPDAVDSSRATPLRELPPEIAQLGELTDLSLRGNELFAVPTEIGDLTELERLDLGDNKFSTFPQEVVLLTGLRHLSIAGNQLLSLPPGVGVFESLESLDVSHNRLYELPPELTSLPALSSLTIGGNRFRGLPDQVLEINPAHLDLSGGNLSEFNLEPGQLSRLTELDLSRNLFRQFPDDVALLSNLRRLDLSSNGLDELPPEVGELTSLEHLDLSNTGLKQDVTDALGPFVHRPGYQTRLAIGGNCFFAADPALQAFIDEQPYASYCEYLGEERH